MDYIKLKKIAILQSNYLPWKGVFDIINSVDVFVFLEDVQYTEHDWRNRNKILTSNGPSWITVPIKSSDRRGQLIYQAEICDKYNWQKKHFNSFQTNYGKAPCYKEYKWIIEEIYLNKKWKNLSKMNIYITKLISNILGIKTDFINSLELKCKGKKDNKVINICKKLGADYYLSGPAAKDYINPKKFKDEKIILDYIDYKYLEYNQLYKPFTHFVTILDLIFNFGNNSPYYIWGWRDN